MDGATHAWQLGLPPTAALINSVSLRPNGCLLALQCDPDRCVILDLTSIPKRPPSQVAESGSLSNSPASPAEPAGPQCV